MTEGALVVTVDGQPSARSKGDVLSEPAGSEPRVDGGNEDAAVWVTTVSGIKAVLGDGTHLSPPWAD